MGEEGWSIYSQWCGEGGSSEGWATVELAKLLNAAEDGLIQSGTRLEFNWSWMNLWSLCLTLFTLVSSSSQASSKGSSDIGSKSRVYWRIPEEVEWQHAHIQEWYLSLPSSRYGWFSASVTLILLSGSIVSIWHIKWIASWVAHCPMEYRAETEGGFTPRLSMCRFAASQAYFRSANVGVPKRSVIKSNCWIGLEAWNKIKNIKFPTISKEIKHLTWVYN